jgi:hypothetical protein
MSQFRPINITLGNNKDNFIHCIFDLTLYLKDNVIKHFHEISYSKHCIIFDSSDLVELNTIERYVLKVNIFNPKDIYIIENIFNINNTIYKNNDIYIEFTQNQNGIGKCCCNLITNDNRLFITPPNY